LRARPPTAGSSSAMRPRSGPRWSNFQAPARTDYPGGQQPSYNDPLGEPYGPGQLWVKLCHARVLCGTAASSLIAAVILQWDMDRVGPGAAVSSGNKSGRWVA